MSVTFVDIELFARFDGEPLTYEEGWDWFDDEAIVTVTVDLPRTWLFWGPHQGLWEVRYGHAGLQWAALREVVQADRGWLIRQREATARTP